jgi:hypothetical protein
MVACNDYILLECCIYRLLKFHFADSPSYGRLLDLFLEVGWRRVLLRVCSCQGARACARHARAHSHTRTCALVPPDNAQSTHTHKHTHTHFNPHTCILCTLRTSQVTYQTSHGQLLDLTTAPPGHIDLGRYTMVRRAHCASGGHTHTRARARARRRDACLQWRPRCVARVLWQRQQAAR